MKLWAFHVSAAAVLGPPQMLSLVETHDDTHPKSALINIHPSCDPNGLSVCVFRASEQRLS